MSVFVQQKEVDIDVYDATPMYALQMSLKWVSNVNLLSMTTPSDLITDDTGRLTLATDTVLTLEATFNCTEDPTSITSDLSAFTSNSLSANQCLTA